MKPNEPWRVSPSTCHGALTEGVVSPWPLLETTERLPSRRSRSTVASHLGPFMAKNKDDAAHHRRQQSVQPSWLNMIVDCARCVRAYVRLQTPQMRESRLVYRHFGKHGEQGPFSALALSRWQQLTLDAMQCHLCIGSSMSNLM